MKDEAEGKTEVSKKKENTCRRGEEKRKNVNIRAGRCGEVDQQL